MIIRQCTADDVDVLAPAFNDYRAYFDSTAREPDTRAFLHRILAGGESVAFIALCDDGTGGVAGFANLYPCYSSLALRRIWILNDLFVAAGFRGRGVSKDLLARVIAFAKENGALRIELKTGADNLAARALYESAGFEIDETHVYYRVPV